jgi:hypothetical protein
MAVILAALLAALALALALSSAVRYLLRRRRRGRRAGSAAADPEKPPSVEVTPPPPALVYSVAGTKLAGAAECAICLAEFVDGDAVRVMPPRLPRALHRAVASRRTAVVLPDVPRAGFDAASHRGCRDCRPLMASYMRALVVFCFLALL